MNRDETHRYMAFLKSNGAYIILDEDALAGWEYALRHFTVEQVRFATLHFLERHPRKDLEPAAIRSTILSLLASGKVQEPMCPDHPEETARHCRGCAADILEGSRPPALRGRALNPVGELVPPPPDLRARFLAIAQGAARDEKSRGSATHPGGG